MKKYKVIGVMSGTSLDGLDIALCHFEKKGKSWAYKVVAANTVNYDAKRKAELSELINSSAEKLVQADAAFGKFIGQQVKKFIDRKKLKSDFISSHGHTIFHRPEEGFTYQIGSGAGIHAACNAPVISDFRSGDVALGGQGAPLVPIGDKLLFSEYEYCLNLGGISNISFDKKEKRVAFDICPVNIVLNSLAKKFNLDYDKGGAIAAKGKTNQDLLEALNNLSFYNQPFPKSLGKEWVDKEIFPLLNSFTISTEDKLATFCSHIAVQIKSIIEKAKIAGRKKSLPRMLVTGGGAFNNYLIERISESLENKVQVVVPDKKTVMFKEALIFAFLGVLRIRNEVNCLKSVTGASRDSIGGTLYGKI